MKKTEIEELVELAKGGDVEAENRLAHILLTEALKIAEKDSKTLPSSMQDRDDFASSAVKSLCTRIMDGRVDYRGDKEFFGLLKLMVKQKAIKNWDKETSAGRNQQNVIGESEFSNGSTTTTLASIAAVNSGNLFVSSGCTDMKNLDEPTRSLVSTVGKELGEQLAQLSKRITPKCVPVLQELLVNRGDIEDYAKSLGKGYAKATVERCIKQIKLEIKKMLGES